MHQLKSGLCALQGNGRANTSARVRRPACLEFPTMSSTLRGEMGDPARQQGGRYAILFFLTPAARASGTLATS